MKPTFPHRAAPTAAPAAHQDPRPAGRRPGHAARADRMDPALIRLAVILLVGGIAPFLDTTIVNVAIAAVGHGLSAPVSAVQWVLTGYLLSFAMVVPLSSWALARFGGRATWMFSLTVFLAGSALCGAVMARIPTPCGVSMTNVSAKVTFVVLYERREVRKWRR